jgi:serine/threonine-protein kinase
VFIKGKPAYMSPEQANGQPLDGRSDLFAVGIMLWEMLIGRRLFVAEDTRATLAAVLFGQIPRPRSLRADIPKDLERVAMKLLDRDLGSRYADAEAALADLLACADAPKAGRELLTAALFERFAGQAPVRQSLLRSRQSLPPGTQPGAHAVPVPSLGAVMNAPTHTMQPAGTRGRARTIAIAAVVALLTLGVVTFAIIAGTRKRGGDRGADVIAGGSAPDAQGSPQAQPEKKPDAPPPADAAEPPPERKVMDAAPPVEPPIDAPIKTPIEKVKPKPKPPETPPKKDETGSQARQPEPVGTGTLVVRADPPVTVFVGSTKHGDTPQDIPLKAGFYSVRLFNADNRVDEPHFITIEANKPFFLRPTKNPNK